MIKILRLIIPRTDSEDGFQSFGEFDPPEDFCSIYEWQVRVFNETYFEVFLLYKDHRDCVAANVEAGFGALNE